MAKALTRALGDAGLLTRVDTLIGTPEYMSLEQAGSSGEDIDTRSGVFQETASARRLGAAYLRADRALVQSPTHGWRFASRDAGGPFGRPPHVVRRRDRRRADGRHVRA